MIGVVLPSRGRPEECKRACESLRNHAIGRIDIVVRLDADDPKLEQYRRLLAVHIVGPRGRGYIDNARMIDEAARLVRGDYIMQFVDDAEMWTHGWDEEYERVMKWDSVGTANVTTPDGSNFRFSFPVISRRLMELNNGRFSLGDSSSVDRCWEAYARYRQCEARAGVHIHHFHIGAVGPGDLTSQEGRTPYGLQIARNQHQWSIGNDTIGRAFAELVAREASGSTSTP
jgi:hypothetical protein